MPPNCWSSCLRTCTPLSVQLWAGVEVKLRASGSSDKYGGSPPRIYTHNQREKLQANAFLFSTQALKSTQFGMTILARKTILTKQPLQQGLTTKAPQVFGTTRYLRKVHISALQAVDNVPSFCPPKDFKVMT